MSNPHECPLWCTYEPPEEWLPHVGDRRYATMMYEFILFRWAQFVSLYLVVLLVPRYWWADYPVWWAPLALWLACGWLLGRAVLGAVAFHHMVGLDDMASLKIKAALIWPLQYLYLAGLFFLMAHC